MKNILVATCCYQVKATFSKIIVVSQKDKTKKKALIKSLKGIFFFLLFLTWTLEFKALKSLTDVRINVIKP